MIWRCWLGGWKGIRPVKNRVVGCWCGYLSGTRCRLAYDPADATVSCFSKIQIGFTFLVPAHLGRPGKRAVKRVCVFLFYHSVHCYSDGWWGVCVRCRLFAYVRADVIASQKPIISCLIKIQTGFTILVPAHPGCPGKRPLNGCCSSIVHL